MADLKLNGITPQGIGKINLGSSAVQKIYSNSTLVWPPSTPAPCTGYSFADKAELQTAVNLWVSDRTSAIATYGEINTWCTGNVTSMSSLFRDKNSFNDDISNWDVSNVTNMGLMFNNVTSFNQNIGSWNVSSVTSMNGMFNGASSFNQDIGSWDVSSVANMSYMFAYTSAFNQDISNWCVSNFSSEPTSFSLDSALTEANKPVWGTCPP